jgi:membrane associated rhomboid family serine protease
MFETKNSIWGNLPIIVKNLLVINILLFLATVVAEKSFGFDLNRLLGLHYFESSDFKIYQPITYMFMHGSFSHIFFNMFALFMFGGLLEQTWGSKRFFTYYMVTGIGAGLVQMIVCYFRVTALSQNLPAELVEMVHNEGLNILLQSKNYIDPTMASLNLAINSVTVGASGAIFGILLAFGILFPNIPLYIMFIPIPVKAKYFVIVYGIIELYLGFANHSGDNVAHFAHLGGMLFGFILIYLWRKKKNP